MTSEDLAFEGDCYDNHSSMLYGLRDTQWKGPCSAEGETDYSMSLSQLIGCFHVAQKNAAARCDAGGWSDNKALRKERWVELGVPRSLIVPTLRTCSFVLDPNQAEVAEFTEDDDGAWTPSYGAADLLVPLDSCCELALTALLAHHRSLILKPARGSNSSGLLCLSIEPSEPLRHVPQASGERRPRPTAPSRLPDGCVWAFVPSKALSALDDYDSVRCVRREDWFRELLLTQSAYLFKSSGGAERTIVVEGLVPYDQEISVLAVNGGRVQVLAGALRTTPPPPTHAAAHTPCHCPLAAHIST